MIIGERNNQLIRIPARRACNGYYIRWYYNGWHYWFFLPGDHTINTEGERYFTLSTRTITMSSGQVTRSQAAAIRTIFFTKEVYLLGIAGWMETRIDPGTPEIYNNMVAGTEIVITAHIGSREISYVSGYTPVPDLPVVPPSEPVMCELNIGTQIWACYNVETDYPGSKVYGNDETNRSKFGGLYNWTQIMASGFCPAGWHIPTLAEWQTLIDFLGGDAVAGGHLKSINAIHWNSPNTDADDSVDFSGRGAGVGIVNSFTGVLEFRHLLNYEYFWTADEADAPWSALSAKCVRLAYDSGAVGKTSGNKLTNYLSVRLLKNSPAPPVSLKYLDYDGNEYEAVVIGTLLVLTSYLKVTHYADGNVIPEITNGAAWMADTGGAMCWYDNDIGNKDKYGALYNYYAVSNPSNIVYLTQGGTLQPGWRVPTETDLRTIADHLGSAFSTTEYDSGYKMKETGTIYWDAPNLGATNESGLSIRGTGSREPFTGLFRLIKQVGVMWTTSVHPMIPTEILTGILEYDQTRFSIGSTYKQSGQPIRLIKDL